MNVTQFQIDCALMSGAVYVSNRNILNQLPSPVGWVSDNYVSLDNGFEAVSFAQGSNIVISFAGTEPTSWADWFANGGLAFGLGSKQLDDAAAYYLRAISVDPNAHFSFTGHSLGGGLASLMAVFFNKSAVTSGFSIGTLYLG